MSEDKEPSFLEMSKRDQDLRREASLPTSGLPDKTKTAKEKVDPEAKTMPDNIMEEWKKAQGIAPKEENVMKEWEQNIEDVKKEFHEAETSPGQEAKVALAETKASVLPPDEIRIPVQTDFETKPRQVETRVAVKVPQIIRPPEMQGVSATAAARAAEQRSDTVPGRKAGFRTELRETTLFNWDKLNRLLRRK